MEWPGNKATFIVAPRPLYFAAMERSQEMPGITSMSCAPNKMRLLWACELRSGCKDGMPQCC